MRTKFSTILRCFGPRRFAVSLGVLAVIVALAMTGVFTRVVKAVSESGVFELDGNAKQDTVLNPPNVVLPEDWQTTNAPFGAATGPSQAITRTGVIADFHGGSGPDATAFFNKQTKDTVDIPGNWTYKSTNVPDKDDISNAYAAAFNAPNGDTIVTFGADRFSAGTGSAFLGFWFFQSDVHPGPGGLFTGQHTNGDTLVLTNYVSGGSLPQVQVLQWCAGCGDVDPNLKQVFIGTEQCGADSGAPACVITDQNVATDVYWSYINKGPKTTVCDPSTNGTGKCSVEPLAFFEGAVNLTQLYGAGNQPCIATYLAETRSSASLGADLKDFASGSFALCGISIDKVCGPNPPTANGNSVTFPYTLTVKNTAGGKLFNAEVTDVQQTSANGTTTKTYNCANTPALCVLTGKGTPGGTVSISDSFTATGIVTAQNSANVAAAPCNGCAPTIVPKPNVPVTVSCQIDIQSDIDVTKNCVSVKLEGTGNTFNVRVKVNGKITNNSPSNTDLTNISLTNTKGPSPIALPKTTLAQNESMDWASEYLAAFGDLIPLCDTGTNCFTDTVTASGKPALGGGAAKTKQATATCPLCPFSACPARP